MEPYDCDYEACIYHNNYFDCNCSHVYQDREHYCPQEKEDNYVITEINSNEDNKTMEYDEKFIANLIIEIANNYKKENETIVNKLNAKILELEQTIESKNKELIEFYKKEAILCCNNCRTFGECELLNYD